MPEKKQRPFRIDDDEAPTARDKPAKRTLSKMTVRTDKHRLDELRRCVVWAQMNGERVTPVSYTHLRAHET